MNKQERQTQILSIITEVNPEQLLSTRELAEEFNVSEITMRRDLQELADAGLIHRQHGGVSVPKVSLPTLTSIGILLVYDYGKFSNPFYNELLEGADSELHRLGHHLAFMKTITQANDAETIQEIVRQQPISGLLVVGTLDSALFDEWQRLVPQIVITLHKVNNSCDTVLFDGVGGMRKMVNHLRELGHKRIGFIVQHNIGENVDERLIGYQLGIQDFGLDDDPALVVEVESTIPRMPVKAGRDGAERMMALDNPPTAIMCMSDLIALGAMQWLQVNGYSIPDDVAVTGFDNIPDAEISYPSLTTVHVHKSYLGKLAIQQLHKRIENPDDPYISIMTPTSLVIRQSCGAKS